jgi:DNA (cytosine-5)-methyltransferase 1
MTFIDLFAGVGGFRRGMELAGHKCMGFCEWDKFATASYTSMHLITEEQRQKLAGMSLKERQKEILKDEYRNGEWYSPDIRQVGAGNVPRVDCWCFGAPCQDFSIAGKRAGLDGDRSSLVREVFRVLGELKEEDRPEWLIYENVKGMLSSNRGGDFLSIILAMEKLGYDIEWQVFNSKYHGVPQNRERVYTLGHLRARGERKVFPLRGAAEEDSADIKQIGRQISKRENPNQYRCYDRKGIGPALSCMGGGGREPHTAIPMALAGHTISEKEISPCLNANDSRKVFGCGQPHAAVGQMFGIDKNIQGTELECANALTAREDRGVSNFKQTGTAVDVTVGYDRGLNEITSDAYPTCNARDYKGVNFRDLGAVCIPVLTPDRAEKRQNGRRFKDNGEEAFTLTAQDKHGVAIGGIYTQVSAEYQRGVCRDTARSNKANKHDNGVVLKIREATVKGYAEAEIGDSVNLSMPESKTRRGRVEKKQANTLDTSCEQGVVVPVIWYEKYKCYIAIRKLTPKECWRLQGWTDDYFEKAQFVNSDSQLYKQAGNGVTVNVVEDIARTIGEIA